MARILIIEDDPDQQAILSRSLQKWGHETVVAARWSAGARLLEEQKDIRLVFLDRLLEDGDGIELCRKLKRDPLTRTLPVVVITSLNDFQEELLTLQGGADLYLTKPVDLNRLKEYVRAMLDRLPYREEKMDHLRCGALTLEPLKREARVGAAAPVFLPKSLFDLLYFLAQRKGKPASRPMIVRRLWDNAVRDKQVDIAVSRLRRLLGPELGKIILAIPGEGYAVDLQFLRPAPGAGTPPSPSPAA